MKPLSDKLIEDGWIPADQPPDNDRTVQLMWDDESFGPNSLGFYDEKAVIPRTGEKFWWGFSVAAHLRIYIIPDDCVIAWREIK